MVLDAQRVAGAVCARLVVRAKTKAQLGRLLRGAKGEKRRRILVAQVKQRTIGCGLGGKECGFDTSLFSSLGGVQQKCKALYQQLCRMIEVENTAANREALRTPDELPFRSSFHPPKLGAATADIKAHELSAAARWAALEEKEDNAELLALDSKYKGKFSQTQRPMSTG